jgi:hypothetical protein
MILGATLGTEIKPGETGTVHEFRTAIDQFKKTDKPQIQTYFKLRQPRFNDADSLEAYKGVLAFRDEIRPYGIYKEFCGRKLLHRHVRIALNRSIRAMLLTNRVMEESAAVEVSESDKKIVEYATDLINKDRTAIHDLEARLKKEAYDVSLPDRQITVISADRKFLYHSDPNRVGTPASHYGIHDTDVYDKIMPKNEGEVPWTDICNRACVRTPRIENAMIGSRSASHFAIRTSWAGRHIP